MNQANAEPSPGAPAIERRPSYATQLVALFAAMAIGGLLGYAAYCKIKKPLPDLYLNFGSVKVSTDHAIAAVEVVVILFMLIMHRRWWAWLVSAAMFAGFVGLSLYASMNGRNCGCFGDCFKPPPFVMPSVDAAIAALSLGLAFALRAPRAALIAGVALCLGAGGAGWALAPRFLPPPPLAPGEDDAVHQLMRSVHMQDIREGTTEPYALNWYIFVHSPNCSVCEGKKRLLDYYANELLTSGDSALQVRMFEIEELETSLGIGHWDWEETPTAFLLEDGQLTKVWVGYAVPENAVELRDMLLADPQSVYDMPSKLDADGNPIPLGTGMGDLADDEADPAADDSGETGEADGAADAASDAPAGDGSEGKAPAEPSVP